MAQFRINHSKVIRQADEMNDLSRDLNAEILRLENLLAQIKREWYGPASDAFQQHQARADCSLSIQIEPSL